MIFAGLDVDRSDGFDFGGTLGTPVQSTNPDTNALSFVIRLGGAYATCCTNFWRLSPSGEDA